MPGNETRITDIVGKEAYDQLAKLDLDIKKVLATYSKAGAEMAKGLSFKPSSLTELNEKTQLYVKNLAEAQKAQVEYNAIVIKRNQLAEDAIRRLREQIKLDEEAYSLTERQALAELRKSRAILATSKAQSNLARSQRENTKAQVQQAKTASDLSKVLGLEAQAELRNANAKRMSQKAAEINAQVENKAALQKRLTAEEVDNLVASLDVENMTYREQAALLSQLKNYSKDIKGGVQAVSPETIASIQKLDQLLKDQDAKLGVYARSVGNYKSHWDGLDMSIAQIAREFPAFAVSLNTGILALSNNIPILADEIKRIRMENAALKAEGQAVVPLWKRIAGSILSWNTVISVGITLLTVYGEDIYDWAKALYAGSNAAAYAADAQKKLNGLQKEAVESYASDVAKLELLYEASQDMSASIDQRREAVNRLRQAYPDYLGKMSEEAILAGKATAAYEAMTKSLQNAAIEKLINAQREDSIKRIAKAKETEIKYQTKVNDLMKAYNVNTIEELRLATYAKTGSNAINVTIDKWVNKIKTAKDLIAAIEEGNMKAAKAFLNTMEEVAFTPSDIRATSYYEAFEKSVADLDKRLSMSEITQEEYDKRINEAKTSLIKAAEAAGIYTAEIGRLEREVTAYNKAHADNSEYTRKLEKRIDIERQIEDSLFNIREDGRDKEREGIEKDFNRRIEDTKRHGGLELKLAETLKREKAVTLARFDAETDSLRQQREIDLRLSIVKKGSKEELDTRMRSLALQEKEEIKSLENQLTNTEELESMRLLVIQKYAKLREDAIADNAREESELIKRQFDAKSLSLDKEESDSLNSLKRRYAKGLISQEQYEEESERMSRDFAIRKAELELDILEASAKNLRGDDAIEAYKAIAKARISLSDMVYDAEVKNAEDAQKKKKEELKKVEDYINKAMALVNAIGNLGSAIFDRQIQQIENEMDANEDAYEQKIDTIDSLAEKDIITKEEAEARKRAAEEETSRKNKELERKKAELQTRQAKFQKSIDIAQTIAATAQAIMVAYKDAGPITGAIFAAMIAATGAVQLATIIAQPIPKYAHGTDNHPGGLAIVGDGGRSEAVLVGDKAYITPDKPTLLSLPAGAEVVPDLNDPAFLSRFVDNMYWITHNKKGEPVQIVNNFDAEGIIRANNEIRKEIGKLSKTISKGSKNIDFENYKRSRMN